MPTYPITLPSDPAPREVTWRPVNKVSVSESPITGQSQVYAHPGQWWEVNFELPPMGEASAWDWESLLLKLFGREGTFYFGPTTDTPRLTVSGTVTVKVLLSDTFVTLEGGTGTVSRGDWLEIGGGLYRVVTGDVFASGEADVELWPRLRSAVVPAAAVDYATPQGTFRLAGDFDWSLNVAKVTDGLTVSAREVV